MDAKQAPGHEMEHMHVVPDVEHISHRAGTLLVGAVYDKSALGNHEIERLPTRAIQDLKKTKDGKTILIPQPTDDPNQSLNWSWARKHKMLFILVLPQAEYWHISPSNAGRNLSGDIFMLGAGGVLAVPLTRWLGRLPIFFWSMLGGFAMTIFAAAAPTWISFIVARCLQGLFITAPQVVGLSMIHDMFFFHGQSTQ
ncbi:hypothetical protein LTR10_011756 [Elasticomyces elasticus]|uniref:Major facilitator superfamily (MFS) profile domain-containing protein n=1 Tax=Exophiala sideris TaxID=1016849 RepID=A0ABR0JDP6_9EURO|nr:hypothetical protein LTR10_011756 [Elasticomyces elasticus]KAK5031787.1 hypothetical protein LTS07_004407 [Exophiala sideris]KAK5040716.1 hypothetical protein LTR13_003016 [Exophiala sideris]KAK5061950.1 hypothetical protein LTR69_005134 [Exophiala sideris]KAK5184650.1 hypothetical protein LTR44_003325 [Eurotiomycetes sp. CCFEE 6388]